MYDFEDNQTPDPIDVTLVLLGSPGSGKSQTGNTILGEKKFKTAVQSSKVTSSMKRVACLKDNINLTVIDTPGIESIGYFHEIKNYLDDTTSENYVFGITLRVGRIETSEIRIIKDLFRRQNSLETLNCRTFFIFTNAYELVDYGKQLSKEDFEEWLESTSDIKELINMHKLEYCVIENTSARIGADENREQISSLLTKIRTTHLKHKEEQMENTKEYQQKLEEKITFSVREIIEIYGELMSCSKSEKVEKLFKILNGKRSTMSRIDIQKALGKIETTERMCIVI